MPIRAVITGVGHGAPEQVMTNDDLAKFVDTNDEWIRQRTGIAERRICRNDETASTLSVTAAKNALAMAGVAATEIDQIILGTVTGDYIFPATACLVQAEIGAVNAAAYDLGAACAGFITSLSVAASLIEAGHIKRALVIGVDVLSKYVDWSDRSTCVLFGDGAGAVVVEAQENTDRGVLDTFLLSDGVGARHIQMDCGGSRNPIVRHEWEGLRKGLHMAGAEVYRFAVNAMGDACNRLLDKAKMSADDIDLFVPHQANLRIIRASQERLGLPDDKVFVNVERYGNTSGGSIPLALSEAVQQGRLKPGMLVMTVGFGAGLIWGSNLIRW